MMGDGQIEDGGKRMQYINESLESFCLSINETSKYVFAWRHNTTSAQSATNNTDEVRDGWFCHRYPYFSDLVNARKILYGLSGITIL